MLSVRSTTLIVLAAVQAFLAPGCGDPTPTFDASTAYSTGSLAGELVFRYKTLDPDRRNVREVRPARKPDAAAAKEAKAATKEAQAATLDDLIRDVAEKAASIPGMTRTQAIREVADEVGKDTSVSEEDRKTISDRLRSRGG